ncbi:MAG: 4-(cytidine 5'-diphospho)-2-C-methyl-D-erythritol kinase [Chitinophagaceae bacterium]
MVVFPNCKINLGLHIRRKRADGYHDLETIFYPVPQKDILEITAAPTGQFHFRQEGLVIDGTSESNLCVKAYRLLKQDFPDLPAIEMFLYKTIPTGAGLGGGSADGAFALRLLNDRFKLGISKEQLVQYALQLGSDCPFFVWNTPVLAESRGEKMRTIELSLSGLCLVVVNPGIHVSTGNAFQSLTLQDVDSHFEQIANEPIENWKNILYNDFEPVIFPRFPAIEKLKTQLYENGALYASMSGSGSSCFGIFRDVPELDLPTEYFQTWFRL